MTPAHSLNRTAVLCAALVLALGIYVTWQARAYPLGTANQMGAGFYPLMLGIAMIVVGAGILVFEAILPAMFSTSRTAVPKEDGGAARDDRSINWRPLAVISLALLVFAALMQFTGLVWSVIALVLIGGAAEPRPKWRMLLPLSLGTAFGAWVIFIVGLGLPLRVF